MRPAKVAAAFVARINAHDVVGLSELMTDDHVFIDALDNRVAGRDGMRAGWQQYLALVPDYWIKVDTILQKGGTVALFGRAGGTYAGSIPKGQSGRWGRCQSPGWQKSGMAAWRCGGCMRTTSRCDG